VRIWRGCASSNRRDAYPEHFRRNVLPALRTIQRFLGATLQREERVGMIEYLVLTNWQDMDAIRAFASTDVSLAVVEPEAVAVLVTFDTTARHFEVVETSA